MHLSATYETFLRGSVLRSEQPKPPRRRNDNFSTSAASWTSILAEWI